jgi:hypothetical protein
VIAVTGLLLIVVTTALPRSVGVGLGLAVFLACMGELGRELGPRTRWLALVGASVLLALTLFPIYVLGVAVAWVALAAGAARWLGFRRRLVPTAVWFLASFLVVSSNAEPVSLALASIGPVAFLAAARRAPSGLSSRVLLIAAILFAAWLNFYLGGLILWNEVYRFAPAGSAIRAVARAGLLLLIPAALGLALFLDWLQQRGRPILAAVVAVGCLLEQAVTTPSFDKLAQRVAGAEIAAQVGPGCPAFLYSPRAAQVIPPHYQVDAMWASLVRRVPTVNGYSGNAPPGWADLAECSVGGRGDEERVEAALSRWCAAHGVKRTDICWIKGPAR